MPYFLTRPLCGHPDWWDTQLFFWARNSVFSIDSLIVFLCFINRGWKFLYIYKEKVWKICFLLRMSAQLPILTQRANGTWNPILQRGKVFIRDSVSAFFLRVDMHCTSRYYLKVRTFSSPEAFSSWLYRCRRVECLSSVKKCLYVI